MASTTAAVRGDTYETKSSADGIEELSKKLTVDLRKHIRALGPYPIMSDKWMYMADSVARIANVSAMESTLPKDKEDASLWECEELALRYLLEDGKLNLCLRLLDEYYTLKAEVEAGSRSVTTAQQEQLDKFENGMGVLLANAWMHAEALQTTDLPLLVNHISRVLAVAAECEYKEDLGDSQPAAVLRYMHALGKHLDAVDETRVLPVMLENHTVKCMITHVAKNHAKLSEGDKAASAHALALLADSEEFRTHPDAFLEDDDTRRALIDIKTGFVAAMTSGAPDTRKALRPLLDLMDRAERKLLK